jgi:rod shape-determining protein MreC
VARYREDENFGLVVRRIVLGGLVVLCLLLVAVWRIDNPRVERLRAQVVEAIVPRLEWALVPLTVMTRMAGDFQSYSRLYEQNQQLRRELQQMRSWREAAIQLEQENARLLELNNVRLDPELTFVTGTVLADSGTTFRRSVLLNLGSQDDVRDGLAAMDGIGLVGRIAGVGESTSRVLLLSDSASLVPVTVQPSGQRALLVGDNSVAPLLEFVENPDQVRPGDRVVSSGDDGLFPSGLLVGQVALDRDGRFRVRLAADYGRLEYLRVLRAQPRAPVAPPIPVVEADTARPDGEAAPWDTAAEAVPEGAPGD